MPSQVCLLTLFLSATLLCIEINASDSFFFTSQPDAHPTAIEGQSLLLPCSVDDPTHIDFQWTFNNTPIENGPRRYVNGSNLIIDPVYRPRDAGPYQCNPRNASSGWGISSRIAQLEVEWVGRNVSVEGTTVGSGVELRCQAEGVNLGYSWYRNNVLVAADGERVTLDEGKLVIRSLTVADNGVYSCTVKNGAGEVDSGRDYTVMVKGEDIANIQVPPKDMTVTKLGASAQFDCVFANASRLEWYGRDDAPLKNNTRRTLFPNGTLFIPKVKSEDQGFYRCQGFKRGKEPGNGQVYTARLKIASLPGLSAKNLFPRPTTSNKYIVKSGSTLEVFCNASMTKEAFPLPTMQWISGKGRIMAEGPFWIIDSVQTNHSGNYTCRAQTPFAVVNYTVFLIVTVPPVMSRVPSDATINEGDSFQLICSYIGSPPPLTTITWHRFPPGAHNYIPVISRDRFSVVSRDTSSVLTVSSAQAEMDAGSYRCQVNTSGFDAVLSEAGIVRVQERLKFVAKPMDQYLVLNEKEKVVCRARATDPVSVQWSLLDGKPFPHHVTQTNGTLVFENVQYADQGIYSCVIRTAAESLNATIRIDVVIRPAFTTKPADHIAVTAGSAIVLHCNGTGDPSPAVHWSRAEDHSINQTVMERWEVLENGSLVINASRVNDSGTYACTIGNKGGFSRAEAVVIVQLESPSSTTQTIAITIACTVCYVLIVLLLIVFCKRKRERKAEATHQPLTVFSPTHTIGHTASHPGSTPESQALLMQNTSHSPFNVSHLTHPLSATSQRRYEKGPIMSGGSDDCRYSPNTSSAYSSAVNSGSNGGGMHYSRNQLCNVKSVGKGNFGEILVAGIREGPFPFVLVKTVYTRDEDLRKQLSTEMDMLYRIDHLNVAKYVGLCRATRNHPDWALFEHYEFGDLGAFIRMYSKKLTQWLLVDFANQIAQGMKCISEARFIHRDLATRNCIVQLTPGGQPIIKVSVLSITRDGHYDQDYVPYHNRLIPLRWMPSEALFEDEFSVKSDVWSFGVVCFELLTVCRVQPYAEYSDDEVLHLLETGTLELDLKEVNSERGSKLIKGCLEKNPKDRPTFGHILNLWGLYYKSDDSSSEYQEIGPRFA